MESWIITLNASSAPPPFTPPPPPALAHLDLFTSRTVEDGRDRFRVHLGHFEDTRSAVGALKLVRESYPAAWLVPASRYRSLTRLAGNAIEAPPMTQAPGVANPVPPAELTADADPMLENAEVFALLDGAADLLNRVLPEYTLAESVAEDEPTDGEVVLDGAAASATGKSGDASGAKSVTAADALVSSFSRFIIEEWRPEARRPAAPPTTRRWYHRLSRMKHRA